MSKLYDFHVATDAGGDSIALREALLRLGLTDDALVQRGLAFNTRTGRHYASCPLIDIHMSKKVSDLVELRDLQSVSDALLRASKCAGYWHSEFTEFDISVTNSAGNSLLQPPFHTLDVEPRDENKTWDLHVSMLTDQISEPLACMLLDHGLYSIERAKRVGNVTVWTLQGVNKVEVGRQLARQLLWWLGRIGAPPFDFKFEITIAMERVNSPRLVPPTISHVLWR